MVARAEAASQLPVADGLRAFTVSYSEVNAIRQYICNQAEHHKTRSFEDEFRAFLQRHQIAFDEEYLFETEFHG